MHVGRFRGFVSRIDSREVRQLTPPRLPIEPLRVSGCCKVERSVDEDFEEWIIAKEGACVAAVLGERRNECNQHDQARLDHHARNVCDAPDVLGAVRVSEPEVAAQVLPDLVAVEQIRGHTSPL